MNDTVTAIIVDDEAFARESLQTLIRSYTPSVQVLGEAARVTEAVQLIREQDPQVVFLDIEMPSQDGFQLFSYFEPVCFQTIFVTAYEGFALKAFRFAAMDYLLKPIDPTELQDAVSRISQLARTETVRPDYPSLVEQIRNRNLDRIAIPTTDGLDMVPLKDILHLEGDGNYSVLYLKSGRKVVSSKLLGYFEELLSEKGFLRIHQANLVNLFEIMHYHKGRGGQVTLSNGKVLDVAARRKNDLLRCLKG